MDIKWISTGTPYTTFFTHAVGISMGLCSIGCFYLMIFHTTGECKANISDWGCSTSFDILDIYIACVMIFVDTFLFAMFCYKWWSIVKLLKPAEKDGKIPKGVWAGFAMQFTCVTIAMMSCVIDGIINYFFMDTHDTMIVFIVDCAIVSTCNFAMLKESQDFLRRQCRLLCHLCCYCYYKGNIAEKDMKTIQKINNLNVYDSKTEKTYTGTCKTYAVSVQSQYESGNISHVHDARRPTVESTNIAMPSVNPGEITNGAIRIHSDSNHNLDTGINTNKPRISDVTAIEEEALDLAELVMKDEIRQSQDLEDMMDIDAVLSKIQTIHDNPDGNNDGDNNNDNSSIDSNEEIDADEAIDLAELVMATNSNQQHPSTEENTTKGDESLEQINATTPSTQENTTPQFEVVISNKL